MGNPALIEELERQFGDNPQRVFARLASEYRKAGELARAIELCRTYVPQQPGYISGHIVLGQALYESGELDEAQQTFETALQLDPENLIALRQLGDIAYARGDIAGARSWYTRLLDVDPQNEEVVAQLAALDQPASAPPRAPAPAAPAPAAETEARPADFTLHHIAAEVQDALPAGAEAPGGGPAAGDTPAADAQSTTARQTPSDAELSAWWESDGSAPAAAEPPTTAPEREEREGAQPSLGLESFAAMFGETTLGEDTEERRPADSPVPSLTSADDSPFIDLGAPSGAGEGAESRPVAPAVDLSLPPLEIESTELELGTPESQSADLPAEQRPWSPFDSMSAEPSSDAGMPWESKPAAEQTDASGNQDAPFPTVGAAADAGDAAADEPPMPWSPLGTAGSDDESEGDSPAADRRTDTPDAFVTETMAELYVQQGLLRQAVDLYHRLVAIRPEEGALGARLAELEEELALANGAAGRREARDERPALEAAEPDVFSVAPAGDAGDTRDESRDAGMTRGGDAPEPVVPQAEAEPPRHSTFEPSPEVRSESPVETTAGAPAEPVAAAAPRPATRGQTVRAFFSTLGAHRSGRVTPPQPAPTAAEVSSPGSREGRGADRVPDAASSSNDAVPAESSESRASDAGPRHDLPGEPTRAAPSALSLDEVFRETVGRPRSSAHPESLDEFFSEGEEDDTEDAETTGGAPPPTAAADLEAFNAWLEGLKK